jgi:hypothetical protein
MNCPKCNKEMQIIFQPQPTLLIDRSKHAEVIGRCKDCDFDATWEIVTNINGQVYEFNLKQYFFG